MKLYQCVCNVNKLANNVPIQVAANFVQAHITSNPTYPSVPLIALNHIIRILMTEYVQVVYQIVILARLIKIVHFVVRDITYSQIITAACKHVQYYSTVIEIP